MTPQDENIPYGLCHCGCGQKTTVAVWNNARLGHVRGEPKRYVHNHHVRKARPQIGGPFKLRGDQCYLVPLTKGLWTIVSADKLEVAQKRSWSAMWSQTVKAHYAVRGERVDGKTVTFFMHKELLGLPRGRVKRGDHKNGETLDNRSSNLRKATNTESARNKKKYANNTSGFKGVSYSVAKRLYGAYIRVDGLLIHLGFRKTAGEANVLRLKAEDKFFGEFARPS